MLSSILSYLNIVTSTPAQITVTENKNVNQFINQIPQVQNEVVVAPFEYLASMRGKGFRTKLILAFATMLGVKDKTQLEIIDRAISMLHTASLLIDDIQDGSKTRRGVPSAHVVFGTPQTINSANYHYFQAQSELFMLPKWTEAIQAFTEELLLLHHGQGMELYWRDTATIPTEQEYFTMAQNKTGGLFRLIVKLLRTASRDGGGPKGDMDLIPLANILGVIFQIKDDYDNLQSEKMHVAKGFLDDVSEGKFSFPIIHSLQTSNSQENELLRILALRTEDVNLKRTALAYITDTTGSMAYTRRVLIRLHEEMSLLYLGLGVQSVEFEKVMEQLSLNCCP